MRLDDLVNDMKAVDWRNLSPESVHLQVQDLLDRYDYPEVTIDDLRHAQISDSDIAEYMQVKEIFLVMDMV